MHEKRRAQIIIQILYNFANELVSILALESEYIRRCVGDYGVLVQNCQPVFWLEIYSAFLEAVCPRGWTETPRKCVKMAKMGIVFEEARRICESESAELFVPKDQSEWSELQRLMPSFDLDWRKHYLWLGLERLEMFSTAFPPKLVTVSHGIEGSGWTRESSRWHPQTKMLIRKPNQGYKYPRAIAGRWFLVRFGPKFANIMCQLHYLYIKREKPRSRHLSKVEIGPNNWRRK